MLILSIDPSVNNVGIALHCTVTGRVRSTCFHPKRSETDKMCVIGMQIVDHILLNFLQKEKKPDVLIIEYPQWEASKRGLIAMQQGYILDLAFIVGYVTGHLNLAPAKTFTPTPRDWKGQTPKAATEHRVKRKFGNLLSPRITEHEYDALGMILWYLTL